MRQLFLHTLNGKEYQLYRLCYIVKLSVLFAEVQKWCAKHHSRGPVMLCYVYCISYWTGAYKVKTGAMLDLSSLLIHLPSSCHDSAH